MKKDKCLWRPASPHLERFRDHHLTSHITSDITVKHTNTSLSFLGFVEKVSVVVCIPLPTWSWKATLRQSQLSSGREMSRSETYLSEKQWLLAGSSISVNNTRRTIRSLSVFKMGIEIKREFPFKVYLRNVNQPGIWGLINFHFPNQIYTIQAVLCTLHLGSCIQAGFLCLFSSQARWISEVRFVNTIILVVQC